MVIAQIWHLRGLNLTEICEIPTFHGATRDMILSTLASKLLLWFLAKEMAPASASGLAGGVD